MNTDEYKDASKPDSGDDLQQITGIGPGYAEALNKIGIYHFADFLQYETSEELRQALMEVGVSIPIWKITRSDWLGQAKAKVKAYETAREAAQEKHKAGNPTHEPGQDLSQRWTQFAGFNLYFEYRTGEDGEREWQTRVYKSLEPDNFNGKKEFSGVDPASWVEWILAEAKLPVDAGAPPVEITIEKTGPTPVPVATPTAAVGMEILDVQITQLPPSSSFPEKQLDAKVQFRLFGDEAELLTADRPPFRVEVHAVEMESKLSKLVASGQSLLQPDLTEYTSHQTFPFPELGRYELHSLVILLPPAEMMTYHRGPTISIVP
jgi:hypothetical protein